jgi:hypothetical protein
MNNLVSISLFRAHQSNYTVRDRTELSLCLFANLPVIATVLYIRGIAATQTVIFNNRNHLSSHPPLERYTRHH